MLIAAGFQVPAMPSFEVAGSAGAAEFWHSGPIASKVGVICVDIVTFNVVAMAHDPPVGVNV